MTLNILSLTPLPQTIQEQIQAVHPSASLTLAPGWFDGEIRDTWPAFTSNRYVAKGSNGNGTRGRAGCVAGDGGDRRGRLPLPA